MTAYTTLSAAKTVQDRCIVSIKVEYEVTRALLNDVCYNFKVFPKSFTTLYVITSSNYSYSTTEMFAGTVFTARGYAKCGICRHRVSVCVCVCHTPVLYQNG